jgi:3-oxoacyl-[acyl-carrier-protein] synthase II
MTHRRVVVTGMGGDTAAGRDAASTWDAILAGRSGVRTLPEAVEQKVQCTIGAPVVDYVPPPTKQDMTRLGRTTQLGLGAAAEAVLDAGVAGAAIDLSRAGVIAATGIGDASEHIRQTQAWMAKGLRAIHPLYVPKVMPNAPAAHIALEFGFRGTSFAPTSACAASAHALAVALRLIRADDIDMAIAGGSDEMFSTLLPLAAFDVLRALSRRNNDPAGASRPVDAGRDGFVLGEGAGMLVLEELEHAKRRGARIYAELCGAGMTGDAHHIVAPEPTGDGAIRAMQRAIADSRRAPSDVQHISAHGTSTPLNDRIECAAIHTTFGAHAKRVAIGATKSVLGHTIGASAAIASISTIRSIRDGVVPPIANYTTPDPACDLDFVRGSARETPVGLALVNAFGFGGHCVSLAFGRFSG